MERKDPILFAAIFEEGEKHAIFLFNTPVWATQSSKDMTNKFQEDFESKGFNKVCIYTEDICNVNKGLCFLKVSFGTTREQWEFTRCFNQSRTSFSWTIVPRITMKYERERKRVARSIILRYLNNLGHNIHDKNLKHFTHWQYKPSFWFVFKLNIERLNLGCPTQ